MQVAGWIAAFGHIQTCRVRERVFPNVVQPIVLRLMLPCPMLSQHAAAKDKQSFETGQASLLKVFSQLKPEKTERFPLK